MPTRLSVSADDHYVGVASVATADQLHLVDLHKRKHILSLGRSQDFVESLLFVDDKHFMTVGFGGKITLRSVPDGRIVRETPEENLPYAKLAYNPKRKLLAHSFFTEQQVRLLNANDFTCLASVKPPAVAECLIFSPDGAYLAIGCGSAGASDLADVLLYDCRTSAVAAQFAAHSTTVTAVAFSPDGRFLATGAGNTEVRVWSVQELLQRTRPENQAERSGGAKAVGRELVSHRGRR
jgi:WD40 repeat protein